MNRKQVQISIVILALMLVALYFIFRFLTSYPDRYSESQRFNSSRWSVNIKRADEFGSIYSDRILMVNDLCGYVIKAGMKKEKIHAILGPPDYQSVQDQQQGIDRYYIGPESSVDIDPNSLVIKYDKQEQVLSVLIDKG